MEKFTTLSGIIALLDIDNVDTDMIIPKQFLKVVKREGLGKNLFDEMRYDRSGDEVPGFVLNNAPYRDAKILVAGKNFGCGSSREHAPWALKDFGIRCVIAESFADIFYNNCFKNSILPVTLSSGDIAELMAYAATEHPTVSTDLAEQTVTFTDTDNNARIYRFDLEPARKEALLSGLDDIAKTLQSTDDISAFEKKDAALRPWLTAHANA